VDQQIGRPDRSAIGREISSPAAPSKPFAKTAFDRARFKPPAKFRQPHFLVAGQHPLALCGLQQASGTRGFRAFAACGAWLLKLASYATSFVFASARGETGFWFIFMTLISARAAPERRRVPVPIS